MKNKKYQTVGTILKSNIKIVERDIIASFNIVVLCSIKPHIVLVQVQ